MFGVTCSPFLLGGTICYHMEKYLNIENDIVRRFLDDLYMDDCISGSETEEDGFNFYL